MLAMMCWICGEDGRVFQGRANGYNCLDQLLSNYMNEYTYIWMNMQRWDRETWRWKSDDFSDEPKEKVDTTDY